jgi:predicted AAA+ superfamily ATPase
MDVDKNRNPGRYLLTGSANPLLIPRLGDSLAGRMEIIDLMPLSQGEIGNKKEDCIHALFSEQAFKSPSEIVSKHNLYERIVIGGYPSVQNKDLETRQAWMRNYLNLLLARDIKDLANIEKLSEIPNLLKVIAHRASNLLNIAEIARDIKLVGKTVQRYTALLQTIFLIDLLLPWSNNLALRFIKSPKVYLVDTGLLSYLLNVGMERVLKNDSELGKILENFVVGELQKQATWSKTSVDLYHFRTSGGEEVDIILENRSGDIVGIEIKNSSKVTHGDFKGLVYLQEKVKSKFVKGIVFYTGSQVVPFGEGLYAMPINSLWELN